MTEKRHAADIPGRVAADQIDGNSPKPESQSQSPHKVYRIGLYGRPSSGKTCMLAALGFMGLNNIHRMNKDFIWGKIFG